MATTMRTTRMGHVIHHRFVTMVKMSPVLCQFCDKPMYIGLKCRECKYKCHRDCEDKVPPSCGLPHELVDVFKATLQQQQQQQMMVQTSHSVENFPASFSFSPGGLGSSLGSSKSTEGLSPSSIRSEYRGRETTRLNHHPHHRPQPKSSSKTSSTISSQSPNHRKFKGGDSRPIINITPFGGAGDSSSTSSSCTSSSPSPALFGPSDVTIHTPTSAPQTRNTFHFPEVSGPVSSSSTSTSSEVQTTQSIHQPFSVNHSFIPEVIDTRKSNDSERTMTIASGSTDSERTLSGRIDSQDSQTMSLDEDSRNWPRQNSLTSREWEIPYEELKIEDAIGSGRFGTVYKGQWHGAVAVKMFNMLEMDDVKIMEAFRSEVATFRKTRHDNLVLFMGACMKPPHLAIVTSHCKGSTLYTHLHIKKTKLTTAWIPIAQQICQGMSYLHARGIIHKDLKTKNLFYENGKVVITDFGLFSVTKLCQDNRREDWLTIPRGWLCYQAPELMRRLKPGDQEYNLPFSTATDVFAFGTVWYELLCGEWPFKQGNATPPEVILFMVGRGIKPSLGTLRSVKSVKDFHVTLLMDCWEFQPSRRPDFAKLLDTLNRVPKKKGLERSPSHPLTTHRPSESIF